MKKILVGVGILLIIILNYNFLIFKQNKTEKVVDGRGLKIEVGPTKVEVRKSEITDFPFTVQAPLGEWENPIFQDGCEEASVLMVQCALRQVQGEPCPVKDGVIDKNWAREEIIKMSDGVPDTSAEDTAEKFLTNVKYQIINFKNMEDLKTGVWIVPMNGQKLGNPYYKAPGPERHMILVIGYDVKTDELITNDPGTKHGKEYRYKLETFWQAIRDYSTGEHKEIVGVEKRGILVGWN